MQQPPATGPDSSPSEKEAPRTRPLERFWPYADLPEEPSAEELAALDPDLHAALFGGPAGPFSITLAFAPFEGPDFARAIELARQSRDYRESGSGATHRHRATFYSTDAAALRDLFRLVDDRGECEVLVDGRPLPYARELWLPLVWFLLPR
jgi:hypothetical protein